MTIKKMVLVLVILGAGMALFANGQREGYGKNREEFKQLIDSKEKVTLTGELIITNRVLPELKVGNNLYRLMVPPFYLTDLELEEGTQVSVEGVILKVKDDIHTRMLNEGEEVFFVTKAVIDGKEYDLEKLSLDRPYRGMMGNWGGRFKGHHGPGFHGGFCDMFE